MVKDKCSKVTKMLMTVTNLGKTIPKCRSKGPNMQTESCTQNVYFFSIMVFAKLNHICYMSITQQNQSVIGW